MCKNVMKVGTVDLRGPEYRVRHILDDEKTYRNALLRRAAGARNRTAPYVYCLILQFRDSAKS